MMPSAVQAALRKGAVDIGPVGFDDASGFGRLDAVSTINMPEPGATVQLVAGLAGLLVIASWRARRRAAGTVQRASSRPH
jgi:MYXO-CTERM domain-containing protein